MKILFIHHGDHKGGAPLSMLYTMKAVRERGYTPIVGLAIPTPELKALYNDTQIETIDMPWIKMIYFWSANPMPWWKPSTYLVVLRALYHTYFGEKLTQRIIDENKVDIVHLNSVSLCTVVPFLLKINFPFVWHIREHAPKSGSLILKKITTLMRRAKNVVFLSEEEQISWLGAKNHGTVVYNFVNKEKFDFAIDSDEVKRQLNIPSTDRIVLYLGGLKPHKGVDILIDALYKLKIKYPDLKCIMPDSVINDNAKLTGKGLVKRILGIRNFEQLMIDKIETYQLQNVCIRIPFDSNAQKYFSICEAVIFPAVVPHFARPVIEAGMMKKPVVVTDWPVLLEVVKPDITGLVVPPNNVEDLYKAIDLLLSDSKLRDRFGENAYMYVLDTFTPEAQIGKIINMYQSYFIS